MTERSAAGVSMGNTPWRPPMLRPLFAAVCVALCALPAAGQPARLAVGDAAPELALAGYISAPEGAPATLADLRGKVVVLEFWATWCAPCVAAIPHLNEVAEAVEGEPVVFISITGEARDAVGPFLEKRPMRPWVAMDREGATARAYGVRFIPHTVVIGRDGRIAAITDPEAVNAGTLRDAVAGKPLGLREKVDRPADLEWDTADGLAADEEAAIAHVVLQRSDATGGTMRFLPGSGRIQGDGLGWQVLMQIAYDVEPSQVSGEVPELDGQVFRISVKAGAGKDAAAREMLRDIVALALGVVGEMKAEERPAAVLVRTPGAAGPAPSTGGEGGSMARSGHFKLRRATMPYVAEMLGGFALRRPGVDETGLEGEFDMELKWTPGDRESLDAALAAHGLEVRTEPRSIPILHVRREIERNGSKDQGN